MAKKATKKTAPKTNSAPEFGTLALLVLIVETARGAVEKISTFLPSDAPILGEACVAVEDGSRRFWNCSPEKAKALYEHLTDMQGQIMYGSGSWLALQAARSDMNSMHAYKAKAGDSARYELRVISKPVTS